MAWVPPFLSQSEIDAIPRRSDEVLNFIRSKDGPRDFWRPLEDERTFEGLTFKVEELWKAGVKPEFISQWIGGIEIPGLDDSLPFFDVPDYPRFHIYAEEAATEINRLHLRRKMFLYDVELSQPPSDLSTAPGNLIIRKARNRLVTD